MSGRSRMALRLHYLHALSCGEAISQSQRVDLSLILTLNPIVGMLFVVGLFVWMAFHPHSTGALKIFFFIAVWILFGPLSEAIMNAENAAFPFKFDYHLYLIDRSLGLSAFSIARHFLPWHRSILLVVYDTLGHLMVFWYAMSLRTRDGGSKQLLLTYLVAYGLAPLFYLIVPACGPRHAFGSMFPLGNPAVGPVPIRLDHWPNAIPSLHLTTAIVFVYFAGANRFLRSLAWIYLAGTAAATLAFEHYSIDLVIAVPYAYFAILTAKGQFRPAFCNLALVLAWLVSIRFATPLLVMYPPILRILAAATVIGSAFGAEVARLCRGFKAVERVAGPNPEFRSAE